MRSKKTSLGQMIFGHLILFLFCIALPAFFTAIVPVSVTEFARSGGSIRAEVSKRLLFVVPYRHLTVADVISVNDLFRAGATSQSGARWPGAASSSGAVSSEDEAFLVIQGDASLARVEVSPVNIRNVLEKTRAFLDDPNQPRLRLITVANWKFGVVAGGLLSLLTLFYLYILLDSSVRAMGRLLRSSLRPNAET